jgi:hypothetical protein
MKKNSLIGLFVHYDALKCEGQDPKTYCKGNTRIFGTGSVRRLWHVSVEVHYTIDGEEGTHIEKSSFIPSGRMLLGSELGLLVNADYTATVNRVVEELTAKGKAAEVVAVPVKITVRG